MDEHDGAQEPGDPQSAPVLRAGVHLHRVGGGGPGQRSPFHRARAIWRLYWVSLAIFVVCAPRCSSPAGPASPAGPSSSRRSAMWSPSPSADLGRHEPRCAEHGRRPLRRSSSSPCWPWRSTTRALHRDRGRRRHAEPGRGRVSRCRAAQRRTSAGSSCGRRWRRVGGNGAPSSPEPRGEGAGLGGTCPPRSSHERGDPVPHLLARPQGRDRPRDAGHVRAGWHGIPKSVVPPRGRWCRDAGGNSGRSGLHPDQLPAQRRSLREGGGRQR